MNQDLNHDDERFVAEAKAVLDRSAAELEPATTIRLQRTRLNALDAKPSRLRWTVWASGFAMASIAALTLVLWTKQPTPEHHQVPLFEDIDLVLSAENVELAEDLDFYRWLADADTTD